MTRAIALVMTALLMGCARTPVALTQLVEARRLAADLRVQFTKASDAANRAVMSSAGAVRRSKSIATGDRNRREGSRRAQAHPGAAGVSRRASNTGGVHQEFPGGPQKSMTSSCLWRSRTRTSRHSNSPLMHPERRRLRSRTHSKARPAFPRAKLRAASRRSSLRRTGRFSKCECYKRRTSRSLMTHP